MAELVAGNTQDNEPLAGVALVELVHLGVIPGGRTSERCNILDEDNFTQKRGEIKSFSCQQLGREIVELRRHVFFSTSSCLVSWDCYPEDFSFNLL